MQEVKLKVIFEDGKSQAAKLSVDTTFDELSDCFVEDVKKMDTQQYEFIFFKDQKKTQPIDQKWTLLEASIVNDQVIYGFFRQKNSSAMQSNIGSTFEVTIFQDNEECAQFDCNITATLKQIVTTLKENGCDLGQFSQVFLIPQSQPKMLIQRQDYDTSFQQMGVSANFSLKFISQSLIGQNQTQIAPQSFEPKQILTQIAPQSFEPKSIISNVVNLQSEVKLKVIFEDGKFQSVNTSISTTLWELSNCLVEDVKKQSPSLFKFIFFRDQECSLGIDSNLTLQQARIVDNAILFGGYMQINKQVQVSILQDSDEIATFDYTNNCTLLQMLDILKSNGINVDQFTQVFLIPNSDTLVKREITQDQFTTNLQLLGALSNYNLKFIMTQNQQNIQPKFNTLKKETLYKDNGQNNFSRPKSPVISQDYNQQLRGSIRLQSNNHQYPIIDNKRINLQTNLQTNPLTQMQKREYQNQIVSIYKNGELVTYYDLERQVEVKFDMAGARKQQTKNQKEITLPKLDDIESSLSINQTVVLFVKDQRAIYILWKEKPLISMFKQNF